MKIWTPRRSCTYSIRFLITSVPSVTAINPNESYSKWEWHLRETPVIGSGGYFTRRRFKWHNSPCEDKSWGVNNGFILQGTASRHRLGLFTAGDLLLKAVCYALIKHSLHTRSPTGINDNTWSGKTRIRQTSRVSDAHGYAAICLCSVFALSCFAFCRLLDERCAYEARVSGNAEMLFWLLWCCAEADGWSLKRIKMMFWSEQ